MSRRSARKSKIGLDIRQKKFDNMREQSSHKRPGSLNAKKNPVTGGNR